MGLGLRLEGEGRVVWGLTEILQEPIPMSMSMPLLIAAVAVGIAPLMPVGVPIAMEPIPPPVELIMLDCISMATPLLTGLIG